MVPNVGSTDRLVRYILAAVFLLIALFTSSAWGWLFVLLAVIMLITAALNFCPLWALFKINTRGKAT
jgi:hypothetical protein